MNATIFHSLEELQLQALFLGRSFVCFLYFDVEELPNCAVCTVWEVATVYMSVIYLSVHHISAVVLSGVGFGMVIISAIVCIYYNVIIAWTVYYFVLSFAWELPWSTCNNDWNTPACYTRSGNNSHYDGFNASAAAAANVTLNKTRSPSEEFFEYVTFSTEHFVLLVRFCIVVGYWGMMITWPA